MKANLKKMLGLAALGLSLLATTVPTWAGYKFTPEVLIETFNGGYFVHGSMVGARYSADTKQNIGCTAYALPGSSTWTSCSATDRLGTSLVCGSWDPRWAAVVQGLTDSSYIAFEMRNGNGGDCSSIQIFNESHLLK